MLKTLKIVSLCTASMLAAGAAHAQNDAGENRGVYLAVRGGLANLSDVAIDYQDEGGTFGGTGPVDVIETDGKTKSAFTFTGALGYDFGALRADVEIDYSRNKFSGIEIKTVNGGPVGTLTPADAADFCDYAEVSDCSVSGNTINFSGGRVRQLSGIANLWYDIPVGVAITPYVGGGLGIGGFETGGEGKARFTWQLGAGVAVNLSPTVALTADFRHRQISGATFTDDGFPDYALRVGKLRTNSVTAGLRFTF